MCVEGGYRHEEKKMRRKFYFLFFSRETAFDDIGVRKTVSA